MERPLARTVATALGKQLVLKTTSNPNYINQLLSGHALSDINHLKSLVANKQYALAGGFLAHLRDKYTTNHENGIDVIDSYVKTGIRAIVEGDIPPSFNLDNLMMDWERADNGYGGYQPVLTDIDEPTISRVSVQASAGGQTIGNQLKGMGEMMTDQSAVTTYLPGCDNECKSRMSESPGSILSGTGLGGGGAPQGGTVGVRKELLQQTI